MRKSLTFESWEEIGFAITNPRSCLKIDVIGLTKEQLKEFEEWLDKFEEEFKRSVDASILNE